MVNHFFNKSKKLLIFVGCRSVWVIRFLFKFAPKNEHESYFRMIFSIPKTRQRGGKFQFPFGWLEYVDGPSMKSQYKEIFLDDGYDFQAESDMPFIIDCGGNIGLSVIYFKNKYPKSKIVVLEADQLIADVCEANIKRLGLKDVNIIKAAAWNRDGDVNFVRDGADSGMVSNVEGEKMRAVRLADLITAPVDLLKLDIEGSEYAVIDDLCRTGKIDQVQRMICEVHGRANNKSDLGPMFSQLTENGFSLTFNHARSAPDVPGEKEATPFTSAPDGKFLLHMYAWRKN